MPKTEYEKKCREWQTTLARSEELERRNSELSAEVRELREECLLMNNRLLVLDKALIRGASARRTAASSTTALPIARNPLAPLTSDNGLRRLKIHFSLI